MLCGSALQGTAEHSIRGGLQLGVGHLAFGKRKNLWCPANSELGCLWGQQLARG